MMRAINPEHPADAALLAYKSAFRDALHRHGLEHGDVADACLVDESMVSRWTSRKCRDALGPEHLVLLARRFPALAEDLVGHVARACGLDVTAAEATPVRASLSLVIQATAGVQCAAAESEQDGTTLGEARAELEAWDRIDDVRAARIAYLRGVIARTA